MGTMNRSEEEEEDEEEMSEEEEPESPELPDEEEPDDDDDGGGEEFPIGTKNLSSAEFRFARNNRLADNPRTVRSLQ
jgi:hypothetical protein